VYKRSFKVVFYVTCGVTSAQAQRSGGPQRARRGLSALPSEQPGKAGGERAREGQEQGQAARVALSDSLLGDDRLLTQFLLEVCARGQEPRLTELSP
jgi:hypothetical protein